MKIKTACLVMFVTCSVMSWASEIQSATAKELFYAKGTAAQASVLPHKPSGTGKKRKPSQDNGVTTTVPMAAHNTGLKYQLIQQLSDGTEAPVDPDTAFQSGDHIRLSFQSNMKGYLYVVQQGSTGNWSVLFPNPRINAGRNTIDSGNQYVVPASGWFRFDEHPGSERLMVFLSQTPLDSSLPGAAETAEPAGVTVNQSIVDELNNIKAQQVRSRALLFEKDTSPATDGSRPIPAAYVVNKMGQAVVAEINLKHN